LSSPRHELTLRPRVGARDLDTDAIGALLHYADGQRHLGEKALLEAVPDMPSPLGALASVKEIPSSGRGQELIRKAVTAGPSVALP
jgi:hypothetical protein